MQSSNWMVYDILDNLMQVVQMKSVSVSYYILKHLLCVCPADEGLVDV